MVDYISFCASGIGSFGCMSKVLMVLVPLKETLTLYFARVCLYCSLRPLTYGMTTLAPSINFPVDRFCFLLFFCRGLPYCGCLVGFCEGGPFLLQGIGVKNILV